MTVTQANEAVVRRFYDELWNERRQSVAEEIIADAFRFRGSLGTTLTGRDEFKRYVETVFTAFPDWDNRIDEILASDNRVVTRMTWSGTHRGQFRHIEPTGARVRYCRGLLQVVGRFDREGWIVGDTQELWRALGVQSEDAPV